MEIRGGDKRHSIRLKEYDYSEPGFYFVTICVQDKKCILGKIVEEEDRYNGAKIILSNLGEVVRKWLLEMPVNFENVQLDEWTIMPNHLHIIIVINDNSEKCLNNVGAIHELPLPRLARRNMLLAKIIVRFKMNSAKEINELINNYGNKFWQRNYYEHVVRNEKELGQIRNYIISNPTAWYDDPENPSKIKK